MRVLDDMRIRVVLSLPAEAVSVPLARRAVTAALHSAGVARDCVHEVEVALSEACTNVLDHAGGYAYEVVINVEDQQMIMDVLDSGRGFGHLADGQPVATEDSDGEIAEGGRGIALMRAVTDRAVFDSVAGVGGAVHLVKALRWADNADGRNHTGVLPAAVAMTVTEQPATAGDENGETQTGQSPDAAIPED